MERHGAVVEGAGSQLRSMTGTHLANRCAEPAGDRSLRAGSSFGPSGQGPKAAGDAGSRARDDGAEERCSVGEGALVGGLKYRRHRGLVLAEDEVDGLIGGVAKRRQHEVDAGGV